jgi:uncharacterized protein (DUF433 family)
MSTVSYPHIGIREDGKAIIASQGCRYKVRILVEEFLATGASPAQLQQNHPELTLGEIHSALAYYYDHKVEIDREIEELDRLIEDLRSNQENSAITRKLLGARKAQMERE